MERNKKINKLQKNLDHLKLNKKNLSIGIKPPNYFTHFLAKRNITSIAFNYMYHVIAIGLNQAENENRNNNSDNYYCNLLMFDRQSKNINVISIISNTIGPYNCIAFNTAVDSAQDNKFIYLVSIENNCILYECYFDRQQPKWMTREILNINTPAGKKIESIAFNRNGDIIAICNQDTIFLYILDQSYEIQNIKKYIYKPRQKITNINYINIIDSNLNLKFLIIGSKSKIIIELIKVQNGNINFESGQLIEPIIHSPGNERNNNILKKKNPDINCIEVCTINNDASVIAVGCNDFAAIYLFNKDGLKNIYNFYDSVESIALYTDFDKIDIVFGCKNSTTKFYKIDIFGSIYINKSYLLNSKFVVIYTDFFISIYNNLIKFWKLNQHELLSNNDREHNTIFIPSKIKSNPKKLYDYIMALDLNINFDVEFECESGIDAGGMRKIIYDIIKETYIEKYFMNSRGSYIIIKDYPNEKIEKEMYLKLWNDTKQLILFIRNIDCKIALNFGTTLLDVLSSLNLKSYFNYFNDAKKQASNNNDFKNIYRSVNWLLESKLENNFNEDNETYILKLNKTFKELLTNHKEREAAVTAVRRSVAEIAADNSTVLAKRLAGRLTAAEAAKAEAEVEVSKNKLKKEIRFRKFMVDCKFNSWKHLISMVKFLYDIKKYRIEDKFILDFTFNKKYLNQKLKITERINRNNQQQIVEYIERIVASHTNPAETISDHLKHEYPALGIFHRYLYGPDSTDEYRKNFILWIAGTAPTCDIIKIFLVPQEIQIIQRSNGRLVNNGLFSSPSTCATLIDFYKRPANDNTDYMSLDSSRVNDVNEIVLQGIRGMVSNLRVNQNNVYNGNSNSVHTNNNINSSISDSYSNFANNNNRNNLNLNNNNNN